MAVPGSQAAIVHGRQPVSGWLQPGTDKGAVGQTYRSRRSISTLHHRLADFFFNQLYFFKGKGKMTIS